MSKKSGVISNERIMASAIHFVRILLCCSLLLSFYAGSLFAVSLKNDLPTIALTGLMLGYTYNLKSFISRDITWIYTGNATDEVICFAQNSDFNLATGYEFFPDKENVTITPSSFTITNGGAQTTAVSVTIPLNVAYLGKKYQVRVFGQTNTGSARAGAISSILLDISPLYIGYGVTGYNALNKIGLIGNKAYITANIASVQTSTSALFYRIKGAANWTEASPLNNNPAAKSDGTKDFTFEIPASAITTAGVQYYIRSIAGTEYAFAPEPATQGTQSFDGTPYEIEVSRITTGQISSTGSTFSVPDGNPNDGEVKIVAPRGAVSANVDIILEQIDENANSCPATPSFSLSEKPAMIFKLTPNDTRFNKNIDLTLLYFDLNNNGIIDGLIDRDGNETIEESKLKMFWWDGFKWRLVNGTQNQDTAKNTITVKTNHFSYYALFPVNALSPEDYRPAKKIITPNGDGINDEADFSALAEEIKIFDIIGKKIRTISAGTGIWDGKDDDGSIVESGVYIYQFKVDGTLVSGAIAVAK